MRLDARLRFTTLVVGAANRLAVAAARAVAETPGSVYNPLFIYGGPGLGKTHLLSAVGHMAAQLHPDGEVEYVSLDEFVEQLQAAVAAGQMDAFSRRYARIDLLLIDDVQFLTGRRETQAELLRLFERMQAANRQIVLASDRPPQDIPDVDERLLNRLAGGLIVDVGAPDFETRMAILRAICEDRRLAISTGALEELAQFEFDNVRELQGALNRLVAHQTIRPTQPTSRTPVPAPPKRDSEFDDFLAEISTVVQQQVESWQARLREAIQYWSGEGYRTGALERALQGSHAPDVAVLLDQQSTAVERLRSLERAAASVDQGVAGNAVFRDPDRMADAEKLAERAHVGETPPLGPDRAMTREAFQVGVSNQLAVHAADAAVALPGAKYNPLVFYGPSGVGKSHLLHAIGNALQAQGAGTITVAAVHAQHFAEELLAAVQAGTITQWRARYQRVGALLIDDVQFLAGKERTQDEFFSLFNDLVGSGRQIVLSSDRPPADIPDLEARLRSRFEGGLAVPMHPPERELRERLFARFLALNGREAGAELLQVLSGPIVQSVREIIGTVHRLGALADARDEPLSVRLAREESGTGRETPFPGVRSVPRPDTRRDASTSTGRRSFGSGPT